MLLAFLESIRYVGLIFPISFLRIYMGYYFLDNALSHYNGDFLVQPRLARTISEWLPYSPAPTWYQDFLDGVVIPNWKLFAYMTTYVEFFIGFSFLIGFLVRPSSLFGIILCVHSIYAIGAPAVELHKLLLVLFVVMLWMGAGRCLGLDYFFYKRQRGIWW